MGRVKSSIAVTMRYDYACGDFYISEENLVLYVFVK